VPGIIEHLNNIAPEILNSLLLQKQTHILAKAVKFLSQEQQLKIHFNALEGSYALCLTANLIHLVIIQTHRHGKQLDLTTAKFLDEQMIYSSVHIMQQIKIPIFQQNVDYF
jgi:ubiquitin-protein ligase E3 B